MHFNIKGIYPTHGVSCLSVNASADGMLDIGLGLIGELSFELLGWRWLEGRYGV